MEMIAQNDERQQFSAELPHRSLQIGEQPVAVLVVVDDLLPGVAPRHDMVDGALIFDPKSSWHAESLGSGALKGQAKTKNKI